MKSTREASYKQESGIAKRLGGKVVSNSGATHFNKGDISFKNILIDGKTVMSPKLSVSLRMEWFLKISAEAFAMNKDMGVIAFDFEPNGDVYYAVKEGDFKKLLKAYEEVNS